MIDRTYETIPKSYLDLVKEHPLLPIMSEAEEEAAKNLINLLLDLEASVELTEEQDSYLATLTVLLHDYQRKKPLIPDIHGIDLLKLLIKEHGLRQQDLVSIFKTKSIVSMILSGKRNLTVEHIQKLADYFKCSPSAFFPR
ncbi:hypothetical protein BJP34_07990 [Moorena producens PAL-8-15-08-1]|uniref:HTH cro/C1-type domain-containing protein n=1 Tax=Moorena producens PAL-8-15-08-1 TaxID=1458985 RepID=A0A1D8TP75_9CYAN|nr:MULTISPECIES: helix-turn-helix domain-containing protein [Moorena]AOW99404.1 hypothetical protein BJP34_07990 [Moorena producens PAL-8-15-08-1]NEO18284.1 helix-turn-helix domain-containing protein [Moorena sp. SIO4A5]NEQ57375.1 helix-turn-helix domain-containing protein [Moorena sp. SIO4A1]